MTKKNIDLLQLLCQNNYYFKMIYHKEYKVIKSVTLSYYVSKTQALIDIFFYFTNSIFVQIKYKYLI